MDDFCYRNAMHGIYEIAHAIAGNGRKQNVLMIAFSNVEKEHTDYADGRSESVIKSCLGILYDGIAYGNWPWIINGEDTLPNTNTPYVVNPSLTSR